MEDDRTKRTHFIPQTNMAIRRSMDDVSRGNFEKRKTDWWLKYSREVNYVEATLNMPYSCATDKLNSIINLKNINGNPTIGYFYLRFFRDLYTIAQKSNENIEESRLNLSESSNILLSYLNAINSRDRQYLEDIRKNPGCTFGWINNLVPFYHGNNYFTNPRPISDIEEMERTIAHIGALTFHICGENMKDRNPIDSKIILQTIKNTNDDSLLNSLNIYPGYPEIIWQLVSEEIQEDYLASVDWNRTCE